jgi:hypothetical protein
MIDTALPNSDWYSSDAVSASKRFSAACTARSIAVEAAVHPLPDPQGRPLSTDTAWFGPANASRLLVVVSGMHGLECLPGSAIQVGWIESGAPDHLPADTAVLMVHQINPWGCAYQRRFNESNVDLNRNFLDFSEPLPSNTKYPTVHDALKPGGGMGDFGEQAGPFLGGLVAEHGIEGTIDLLMAGQHQFPDGFAYGGQDASWSRTLLERVATTDKALRRRVCYLEIHSGLGPYGYGQLISLQSGAVLERTRRWFGQWVFNPRADRKPGEVGHREVPGHSADGFMRLFPDAEVTPVTLEMGTYSPPETLALLMREHCLHQAADAAPAGELEMVRSQLQEMHCPADPEWRAANWTRGMQVIRQALAGLNDDC